MSMNDRSLGSAERHFWINRCMARSLGINLTEKMMEQGFTPQDYAQLVTRCRNCSEVDTCIDWLATFRTRGHAVPEFCNNKTTFERLLGPRKGSTPET